MNIFLSLCSDTASEPVVSGGYHAVALSYGNSDKTTEATDNDTDNGFQPHFPVPECLRPNLVSKCSLIFLFFSS